jgi:hypothetical protein
MIERMWNTGGKAIERENLTAPKKTCPVPLYSQLIPHRLPRD